MRLVTITKRTSSEPKVISPTQRILSIFVLDKFFLIGAVFGLFGSIFIGAYLWLIRSGLMRGGTPLEYVSLRSLHALMQFYLFFSPFILGFLLQSGSKLFESTVPLPRITKIALPCTVIAAAFLILKPESSFAPLLLSGSILSVALSFIPHLIAASWSVRLRFGIFTVIGLTTLGVGPWVNLGSPTIALLVFWFGIVPVIFASGQQFIAGVLGGRKPSPGESALTLMSLLVTGGALWAGTVPLLSAILALVTFLLFLYSTDIKASLSRLHEPLAVTFILAHVWACVGAFLLSKGGANADAVLHVWGIGYAVTLVIGVSLRLIAWVTDVTVLRGGAVICLLLCWQVVPLLRGLQSSFLFPPSLVWIGVGAGTLALAIWMGSIAISVFAMYRRQHLLIQRNRSLTKVTSIFTN